MLHRSALTASFALCTLLMTGCAPQNDALDANARVSAVEDELRMNHVQAKGTHNSYHIDSWFPIPEWQYTHDELDYQAFNGVRKFELDLHYNPVRNRIDVFHAIVIDRQTQCETLGACLRDIRAFSDAQPDHHPIFVLLETKVNPPSTDTAEFLELLESTIAQSWPEERIITPDEVRGDYDTLREAVTVGGWPHLDDVRGHIFFLLHDNDEYREVYTEGGQDLEGKIMFAQASSPTDDYASILIYNDPQNSYRTIQDAVADGFIVRTRSDSSLNWNDEQAQAALDSGAHYISTDFPYGDEGETYLDIPGGNPSRCNPINAPAGCTSEMIEDL